MNTVATTLFQSLPIPRARSLTTDISPILTWCNADYKEIPSKEFKDEADDPKTTAASVYTTIDICNIFRNSLKPAFRLLANRVNEISSDVENIDVSDQLTTLETKFDNKLKQYVNHDELVRDDEVDINSRVHMLTKYRSSEYAELEFKFEDNIVNGLLVFNVSVSIKSTGSTSSVKRTSRFYIKIVNGDISEYKGVDIDTIIDGKSIEGLAGSEEDRVTYMTNAELIMDTTERLISIPLDLNYRITGGKLEYFTISQQMVYTASDIAYLQDIETLNKKIASLAEQTEDKLREEFATVDEVNTVLTNYVLKSELPHYYTKTESDNKYLQKTGNQTFTGILHINPSDENSFLMPLQVLRPNIAENNYVTFVIGKSLTVNECGYLWYSEPGICGLGIRGTTSIITFNSSAINLLKPTTINGDLTVSGTINNYYNKTEIDNKFALKSEIPEPVDVSEYRKKDDLLFPAERTLEYTQESAKVISTEKFVNGVRFVGKWEDMKEETRDFDILFEANSDSTENTYYCDQYQWILNSTTQRYDFSINYIKYEKLIISSINYMGSEEVALKSQIEELKAENAQLKSKIEEFEARIAALEAK